MSQPVKLSDQLVLDARLTGEAAKRSIAGQIEFWATLGKAIEPLLQGMQSLALSRAGAAMPLSSCLKSINLREGEARLQAHLQGQPYPHYESLPNRPGVLVRIEESGRRTVGRFVRRQFKAVKAQPRRR